MRRRRGVSLLTMVLVAGCGGGSSATDGTDSDSLETTTSVSVGLTSQIAAPTTTAPATTTTTTPTTTAPSTTTTTTPAPEPGVTWERVVHDETVLGGYGVQVMTSVTRGGPGLVAVGYVGGLPFRDDQFELVDAAVWVSADGITWERIPHDDAVFGGQYQEVMTSVVAGGPGLIAVGYDWVHAPGAAPTSKAREIHAAVWVSADGYEWSRIPHDQAVFGGDYYAYMQSVAAAGPGFVAVGHRGPAGSISGSVWTSADGLTWSRVPHSESVFGGYGDERMRGVAAAPGGVVAVGVDSGDEGTSNAAVWFSSDGRTWSRVPHDDSTFGGNGDQEMNAVTAAGLGLVAVGSRWVQEQPGDRFAIVWTSTDGIHWSQVPHDEAVFGGRGQQVMQGVVAGGPGVVAVGGDSAFTGGTHVWASPDGLTWTRILIPEAIRPFSSDGQSIRVPAGGQPWYEIEDINSVVAGGPGLVAVGTTLTLPDGSSAVVLYSPA